MILLDTCAAIRIADGATDIPTATRETIEKRPRLAISAISAWEIATLARPERLRIVGSVDDYIRHLFELPRVNEVPIDRRIALKAGTLADFHGDPADRIIVATALTLKATICTRDRQIIEYASTRGFPLDVLVC